MTCEHCGQAVSSAKAWSSANTKMIPGAATSFSMNEDFSRGGGDGPGNYTLQFNCNAPANTTVAPFTVRAEALVIANCNGNECTRRVSFGPGTGSALTISAEACKVIVTDVSVVGGGGIPAGYQYSASVEIVKGMRGTQSQPPIFIPDAGLGTSQVIAAAGSVDTALPTDAGLVSANCLVASNTPGTAIGAANVLVSFQQKNAIGPTVVLGQFDPTVQTGFQPIPPGCNNINVSVAAGAPVSVRASLVLGVEG